MFEQPSESSPTGVTATFDSECPICDDAIYIGYRIFLSKDKEWICEQCHSDENEENWL